MKDRYLRKRDVFLIDNSKWCIGYLRRFHREELSRTGDSRRWALRCELTLESRNEKSSGAIYDLHHFVTHPGLAHGCAFPQLQEDISMSYFKVVSASMSLEDERRVRGDVVELDPKLQRANGVRLEPISKDEYHTRLKALTEEGRAQAAAPAAPETTGPASGTVQAEPPVEPPAEPPAEPPVEPPVEPVQEKPQEATEAPKQPQKGKDGGKGAGNGKGATKGK